MLPVTYKNLLLLEPVLEVSKDFQREKAVGHIVVWCVYCSIRIMYLFSPPRRKYKEDTCLTFGNVSKQFCMSIQYIVENYSLGL